MTEAETLLKDRLEDLGSTGGDEKPAANVRSTVEYLIQAAWEALYHDNTECTDIIGAGGRIEEAINVLTAYRERLNRLYEVDNDAFMLAAGGTKRANGGWRMPEGWPQVAVATPAPVGAATGSQQIGGSTMPEGVSVPTDIERAVLEAFAPGWEAQATA